MVNDVENSDRRSSLWTVETLHHHLLAVMDERDRRYEERFQAQQRAVEVALATVNKEFHEHIQQVREETDAALNAANLAVTKSEMANEKRFEGVSEFRSQVTTQLAGLLPREEFDRSAGDLTKRLEDLRDMLADKLETASRNFDAKVAAVDAKIAAAQQAIG